MDSPASDKVLEIFLNANLAKKRSMLKFTPRLLSKASAVRLQEIAQSKVSEHTLAIIDSHADLIRACIRDGIDSTFDLLPEYRYNAILELLMKKLSKKYGDYSS